MVLAVSVAAAARFGISGLFYGPLFGHTWTRLLSEHRNVAPEKIVEGSPLPLFGLSVATAISEAALFGFVLQEVPEATPFGLAALKLVLVAFHLTHDPWEGRSLGLTALKMLDEVLVTCSMATAFHFLR